MMLENKKNLNWKFESEFGEYSPDVDKLLWYMRNSKLIRMQVITDFIRTLEQSEKLVHKKLKQQGLSYPGDED